MKNFSRNVNTMNGIGAGKCTLEEHFVEQSLQEGRDCTLRKKERGTYSQPPARPREKS